MRHEEKVPNGKLVCFSVDAEDGRVTKVRVTGDFFLHPEDSIDKVEESLVGTSTEITEEEAVGKIRAALEGAQLIGATAEDFARIFRKAIG
jgi:lipoate-protein ligase A